MSLLKQLITTSPPMSAGIVFDAYRKSHEIEGSAGGAQTNYQVKITAVYEDTPPTSLSERAGNPIADVPRSWATTTFDAPAFLRIDADTIYLFLEGFPNGDTGEMLGRLESNDDGDSWAWSTNCDPITSFANTGQAWSERGDEACPTPIIVNGIKYLFYSSRAIAVGPYGEFATGVATTEDWETFSPMNAINPVLPLGGGGEWDEVGAFHPCKPILKDGTWYMFYTGRRAADGLSQIGLITTSEANFPDNWTKHGGNPFFTGARPKIILVGSTYYMYYAREGGLKRRTSTDLITWTAEVSVNSDIREADIISAGGDYIFAGVSNIWDGNLEVGIWIRSISEVSLRGHSRTDFGDVRFRQGETELDYWIDEKVDEDYAVFFVEVPTIPADPDAATIHIYYGKADATTTSSGADTFPSLYEDFEDGVLGNPPAGWTNDTGFFSVEEDQAYHGTKSVRSNSPAATAKNIYKAITGISGKFILEYALRRDTVSEAQQLFTYSGATQASWLGFAKWGGLDRLYYYNGAYQEIQTYAADTWYKIRQVMDIDADTYDIYVDDALEVSDADFRNLVADVDTLWLRGYDNIHGWFDRILIRKYVSPEPVHSDWGAEEEVVWPF